MYDNAYLLLHNYTKRNDRQTMLNSPNLSQMPTLQKFVKQLEKTSLDSLQVVSEVYRCDRRLFVSPIKRLHINFKFRLFILIVTLIINYDMILLWLILVCTQIMFVIAFSVSYATPNFTSWNGTNIFSSSFNKYKLQGKGLIEYLRCAT